MSSALLLFVIAAALLVAGGGAARADDPAAAAAPDVFPAEHAHGEACGHYLYAGSWHLFPAAHVHGNGCGHYLVVGRWSYFPSAHRHSFECGHFYYDGMWHPFAPGHVHGEGCGHFFHGGCWNPYAEGHVHRAGCGHIFLDGEWRPGVAAVAPSAGGDGGGVSPPRQAPPAVRPEGRTLERANEPEPAREPAVLEPRIPGGAIVPVADERTDETLLAPARAKPMGRAELVEERYIPAGTGARRAPAAARPEPGIAAVPAPAIIAPVAPPRVIPVPPSCVMESRDFVFTMPASRVVVVGPRVRSHRGSYGIAGNSDYSGRWDPGCDVRYEYAPAYGHGGTCGGSAYGGGYYNSGYGGYYGGAVYSGGGGRRGCDVTQRPYTPYYRGGSYSGARWGSR